MLNKTELPTRRQDEPIRAWKTASVSLDPDAGVTRARFIGIGRGVPYSADALAICDLDRTPDHPAPHPGCTCGFYAFGDDHPERPELIPGAWRLEVEISGRVIRHKLGYRAQRQRIIKATPPTLCKCGAWARFLAVHTAGEIGALCRQCVTAREWLPVERARVAGWLGVELGGWHIQGPTALESAPPTSAQPKPSDTGVGAVSGDLAGLATLGKLLADELPSDAGQILADSQLFQRLPCKNLCNTADLHVVTASDRLVLRLVINGGLVAWQRTVLFTGPPLYPYP